MSEREALRLEIQELLDAALDAADSAHLKSLIDKLEDLAYDDGLSIAAYESAPING